MSSWVYSNNFSMKRSDINVGTMSYSFASGLQVKRFVRFSSPAYEDIPGASAPFGLRLGGFGWSIIKQRLQTVGVHVEVPKRIIRIQPDILDSVDFWGLS